MAGVSVKFRCYQCNQLLGVSRSKVGSIITCPKCSTALVVPEPDEAPAAVASPSSPEVPELVDPPSPPETTAAFLSALSSGLPVEIADIRPEDLRVEPSVDWSPPPRTTREAAPPPGDAPPDPRPEVRRSTPFEVASTPIPAATPVPTPISIPVPPSTPADPVVPEIKVEPTSLIPERTTVRSRDLVLPRSVVASWSLFVLLAQALAFVAGLLAGHYIWRVH